ncbi:MAG: LysR family transcriptional regulator [Deltaproteobacteria bacterium]|nr:LysR family transcriptional regulator [Deltaproteobacteria bacterium]
MQIESLKVFCDVVDTGSFSAAARLNHVTQSAVSQQIRALETRYGQKLLSRSARAAVPTAAGSRLYRAAKEIIQAFCGLEVVMREESSQVSGDVVLATIYSVGLHELSAYLKAILRRYPQVNVRLTYRRSDLVVEDVLSDQADMGIVAYPAPRSGVRVLPFRSDELVLVTSRDHPLGCRRTVKLADLEGMRFVAFERDIPTGKAVDSLLREAGVRVQTVMEMDNVETIKRAVELGLGVSILPKATVQAEELAGGLLTKSFCDGTFTRPIGIVLRKGRYLGRAASAVLAVLTQVKQAEPSGNRGGAAA